MKVLFDTNVVLDLLLDRAPFADHAVALFTHVHDGRLQGVLCATTLTTIHYFVAKNRNGKVARQQIQHLLQLFDVAAVTEAVLHEAVQATAFEDFEDAVLNAAAASAGATAIVTRNEVDFESSTLRVYAPAEMLSTLRFR